MVGDAGYGGKEEEEGEDEKVVGQSGAEMLQGTSNWYFWLCGV